MRNTNIQLLSIVSFTIFANTSNAQTLPDAIKMYSYQRYQSALKIAEPLAASNAEANYYDGLSELNLGNTAKAATVFAKQPTDVANICGSARVLFTQKKSAEAVALLNGVIAKAKKKDWQSYKLAADAITYTTGGDLNKAIEWYTKSLEIKDDGETYLAMGDAYYNMPGGSGNAVRKWEYASEKMSNASMPFYKIGTTYYDSKIYDLALENYKKSSDLDATNPLPYKAYANAFYKINKYDLAKQNIEKYISLSDNSADDQIQYANILYLSKDYPATIAKINELIAKKEDKPYMYRLLGYSNYELGNNAEALKNMDVFFTKQDKDKIIPTDYNYYAKILAKTADRNSEASKYYQMSIDADTSSDKSEAYRSLGQNYYDIRDWANAANWYSQLVDKYPNNLENTDEFYAGFCNYYNKDFVKSSQYFTIMSNKYPTEPSAVYWLGRTAAAVDADAKIGGAVDFYKKWIEVQRIIHDHFVHNFYSKCFVMSKMTSKM